MRSDFKQHGDAGCRAAPRRRRRSARARARAGASTPRPDLPGAKQPVRSRSRRAECGAPRMRRSAARALERVEHRIEPWGMERVRDVEALALDTLGRQRRSSSAAHRIRIAGDRRFLPARSSPRSTDDPPQRGVRGRRPRTRGEERRHRAARGQLLHQAPALGDEREPVLEREHTGHARRDVLPDAVTQHDRRRDAPRPPQLRQRELERRRAPAACRPSLRAASRSPAAGNSTSSSGRSRCGRSTAAHESMAARNTGSRLVQCPPHAGVLRALAGEQERDLRPLAGTQRALGHAFGRLAIGDARSVASTVGEPNRRRTPAGARSGCGRSPASRRGRPAVSPAARPDGSAWRRGEGAERRLARAPTSTTTDGSLAVLGCAARPTQAPPRG